MKKLLPYIVGLILLIALVVAVPLLIRPERYRPQIADYLTQRTGRKVLIGKASFQFLPPTLQLHHITMLNESANAPLLQIERGDVKLQLASLFLLRVVPSGLVLHRPLVAFHRRPGGNWGAVSWMPQIQQLRKSSRWPFQFISIDQADVRLVDAFGPTSRELVFQNIDAKLEKDGTTLSAKGQLSSLVSPIDFEFQADGRFFFDPEWSGKLLLREGARQWSVQCVKDAHAFKTTSLSQDWRWDLAYELLRFYSRWDIPGSSAPPGVLISQWDLQTISNTAGTEISQKAMFGGGNTQVQAMLSSAAGEPLLTGRVAVRNVEMSAIEKALTGGNSWEGKLTGSASSVSVHLSSSTWETLSGTGSLEIVQGKYRWPDSLSRTLEKAKTMRYMQNKYPGIVEHGMAFSRLSADWIAENGMIQIEKGSLQMKDVGAKWAARFDAPRRGLEGYVVLHIQENDPTLLSQIPEKYVIAGYKRTIVQPIYGRFQGSLKELYLKATRASNIPPQIRTKLNTKAL